MTWTDAVIDTVADGDVRETVLEPGARVHVDGPTTGQMQQTYVVTNLGDTRLDLAIWVNPRQRNVKVWDPRGKHGQSIEVMFTGDDMHVQRGNLAVDRSTMPA